MHVELVRTDTSDGFRLDGALQTVDDASNKADLDAVILLGGVATNFYSSTFLERIAVGVFESGLSVLQANTRGHDHVATCATNMGSSLQGAAYESVDHCRYDITAWIDLLATRGMNKIALVGHSLGAIKILYSQSYEPHENVRRIVAVSPPILSYTRFLSSHRVDQFERSLAEASAHVADGNPRMLFQASFPFQLVMSAERYLEKYGPKERYNILRFANLVKVPTAFIFGELEIAEPSGAFDQIIPELKKIEWRNITPTFEVISAANHFYSNQSESLNRCLIDSILSF